MREGGLALLNRRRMSMTEQEKSSFAFTKLIVQDLEKMPQPPAGEVILGFTTDDLPALLDRVRAAGGGGTRTSRRSPTSS